MLCNKSFDNLAQVPADSLASFSVSSSVPANPRISSSAFSAPSQSPFAQKLQNWSDSLLYSKCKIYGGNARVWLRKFAGLLPEVNRRQLYKRRGYVSLYEFARKLAGMSDYTVDKIINLAARLEDKPALKEQFTLGNEGWSKIERVAYVATKETDAFWAKKVENLTQQALAVYVQEFRKKESDIYMNFPQSGQLNEKFAVPQGLTSSWGVTKFPVSGDGDNNNHIRQNPWVAGNGAGLGLGFDSANATNAMGAASNAAGVPNWANFSSPESPFSRLSFPVPYELEHELRLFKQKLERERGQTLAWSEVMQELLKGYKPGDGVRMEIKNGAKRKSVIGDVASAAENVAESASVSQKMCSDAGSEITSSPKGNSVADHARNNIGHKADNVTMANSEPGVLQCGQETRHIPAAVKKIIDEKYQHWCAFPGCRRPPNIYHHTRRFSLEKNHDPDSIVPLCKSHERLVHSGLINDGDNPSEWKILAEPDPQSKKFQVDQMAYGFYRKMQSG